MLGKTAGGQEDLWAGRVAGPLLLTGPRNNTHHTPHTTHKTIPWPGHFTTAPRQKGILYCFCYLVTRAGGLSQDYSLRPRLPKARTNKSPASRPTPVGKLARYSRGTSRRPPREYRASLPTGVGRDAGDLF